MDIKASIDSMEEYAEDPTTGLPEDLFLFVSRMTPMINVDLLIKNSNDDTLLTWRDDEFHGSGWHVPGGIIRYKEEIRDRIDAVARNELGVQVEYDPIPLMISEVIHRDKANRAHFISLLYQCRLTSNLDDSQRSIDGIPRQNEWKWHSCCPEDLIKVHHMYRKYI